MLHGEGQIARGSVTSDVDLVVREPPRPVLRKAAPHFRQRGLHPVAVWRYDVGRTATIFLANATASDGVQLDLLSDPRGWGMDGIRSSCLLDESEAGERWPRTHPVHELLYVLRKRQRKRDRIALDYVLTEIRDAHAHEVRDEAPRMFRGDVAESIIRLVEGIGDQAGERRRPRGQWVQETRRRAHRLMRPAGFWAELRGTGGEAGSTALATRFGRFLPHAAWGPHIPGPFGSLAWWLGEVAPVRWRAGLFVSWSLEPGFFRPDLVLFDGTRDIDWLARQVVQKMEERVVKTWC